MIKTLKISGVTKADLTTSNNRERYAWIKNNTGGNVYASVLDSACTAGADNVAEIAAGDVRMVDTLSLGYLWISGNGAVEIQLSDNVNCPFKLSQKGGDVSAEGDSVQLGGLQGGVPFSEVKLTGDIIGKELTVTACGKNLIDYQYRDTPITLHGVTFTYNTDGTITVNGTADASFGVDVCSKKIIKAGEYILSGCPKNGSTETYALRMGRGADNGLWGRDYGDGLVCRLDADDVFTITIQIISGAVCDNLIFRPQFEVGSTATAYEPYSGADYTITPDSNPYTVPTEIYQQDGINTVYVTGEGEPTLSVKGIKTNAAVKRIWDKLNELTTAIIVSNGEI